MQDIQEVFNRLQQARKKQKDIAASYKDALNSSGDYKDLSEEIKNLRLKKTQIETRVKEDFSSEFTKLEDLKIDIETDTELLSDIALSKVMKGEGVEITDEFGNKFEPTFKVKFKKTV